MNKDESLKEIMKEEDLFMRDAIHAYVENEIMPVRRLIDEDSEHKLIQKLMQGVVNLGLQYAVWPEKYGGTNILRALPFCLCEEELARGDGGIAAALGASTWAMMPAIWGENESLQNLFGPIFCGSELKFGSFVMTEPGSQTGGGGCDIENLSLQGRLIKTTAKLEDEYWVVNGQKMWASNAGIADAYSVICTTDPKLGDEGIAIIYIPRGTAGLSFGKFEEKAGMHADRNCTVYLDNVRVPKEYRAAGPGKDARLLHQNLAVGRLGSAAMAVGNAQAIFDIVLQFTSERGAAGRPIREHSMDAAILADMAIGIETARSFYLQAAFKFDNPEVYGLKDSIQSLSRASIAKVYATEVGVMVANKAMELMGSYGYSKDYLVEKYWRDGKMIQIWMGGAQLGRLDVVRGYYSHSL